MLLLYGIYRIRRWLWIWRWVGFWRFVHNFSLNFLLKIEIKGVDFGLQVSFLNDQRDNAYFDLL